MIAGINKGEDIDKEMFPIVLNLNTGENYLTYKASKQLLTELEKTIDTFEKTIREYNEQYDSYYDKRTGEWLSETCSSKTCVYCKDRPKNAKIKQ